MEGITSAVSSIVESLSTTDSSQSSGSSSSSSNSSQSSNSSNSSSDSSQSSNSTNSTDSSQSTQSTVDTILSFIEPVTAATAAPAAEAAEAPAPARRPRRPKAEVIPKDAKTFFMAMAKDPKKYGFSPTGDMAILTPTGTVDTTIPLPTYRETTPEERKDYDTEVREKIRSVETEYDEALKKLKDALILWKETGLSSDAIKTQRELTRLDAERSTLRSPLRWVRSYRNLERKSLLLHSKQPDLGIGHPVFSLHLQSIPFNKRVVVSTGEITAPVKEEVVQAKEERFVVFSTGTEEGVLSPETPMDLTYNGTRYNSILQAYHAERVGQLGNQGLRTSILKATNPKTIRFMGDSLKGVIENPSTRELLISIAKEAAKQDERIAPVLRKTGLDPLVYAEAKDRVLGVGLSIDAKEQLVQRDAWMGENLLGQAWEVVRIGLEDGVQSGGAVLEKARTLEDVKKERSHVLMGMYRKRH
jgi:predicted NAD-dependent protein-ADP-ribosyltransferase YbiA (DUF1768 family)